MAVNEKTNIDNLKEYNIYAGLGGSFGGAQYMYTTLCESEEEAEQEAYEQARDEYESYSGCHNGLMTWEEAMTEAESQLSEDENEDDLEALAEEIYYETREGWLDYCAILTSEDTKTPKDSLIKGYLIEEECGDSTCEVSCEGE